MSSPTNFSDKVHKSLRTRTIIYLVISVVILAISIFHIVTDGASIFGSFLGLVIGTVIGIAVSRMYKISWDKDAMQVISSFDTIGIIILVLYVAFELFREKIVGQFVDTPSVIAVSFAVLAGVMYGRVLGIRGKIRQVFKEEGVL